MIDLTSLEYGVRAEEQAFERLTWQAEPRPSEAKPKNSCYNYLGTLFLKISGREYPERLRFFSYISEPGHRNTDFRGDSACW